MPDRVVIGSETNDERKIELETAGLKYALPVIPLDGSGNSITLAASLVTEAHDELVLTYSGTNLTVVVYKLLGTTVATLTLGYDSSDNLTSVIKT